MREGNFLGERGRRQLAVKVVSLYRVCVWAGRKVTHGWLRLGFSIFSPLNSALKATCLASYHLSPGFLPDQ